MFLLLVFFKAQVERGIPGSWAAILLGKNWEEKGFQVGEQFTNENIWVRMCYQ